MRYKIVGLFMNSEEESDLTYTYTKHVNLPVSFGTQEVCKVGQKVMLTYCEEWEVLCFVKVFTVNSDESETLIAVYKEDYDEDYDEDDDEYYEEDYYSQVYEEDYDEDDDEYYEDSIGAL